MMRTACLSTFLALALLLACAGPVAAQTEQEAAIRDVITRQLEALRRGDAHAAFAVASPAIQAMFGDAAKFMGMVERGYPQIWRSRSHRFLRLETIDGKPVQRVLIESAAGTIVARYEMAELAGTWRINGVSVEKSDGA
jgi:hypothetical protein